MRPPESPAAAPRAQLCFGVVRHKRLRPAANAFCYRAYYLRLPIRTLGQAGLDCALLSHNRFNLLSFHDADHGDGSTPLADWIDTLLRAHGVADADGEIWLQAMPRVLGFVFNPVSFWFCHRADGALRAVLCDVRNTFGERHFYLLDNGGAIPNGSQVSARKVFHVSPFLQAGGRYVFRFLRAARAVRGRPAESTIARIDYDDGGGAVLQASVSGLARPVSNASAAAAFFQYPLMTFGVVFFIHLQAARLWFKRITFHSKPAPPSHKVSR